MVLLYGMGNYVLLNICDANREGVDDNLRRFGGAPEVVAADAATN